LAQLSYVFGVLELLPSLAGRLGRAQTALRTLGIGIAFGRHEPHETVSIVSTVIAASSSETSEKLPQGVPVGRVKCMATSREAQDR
jgi:hypothetical protein